MVRVERGFSQALSESITRSRKNLKESRKEALLALKKQVLTELIANPTELPHWVECINNDGLVQFSKDNKDNLARDRKKIIERDIMPRKKSLRIPPFEERQHRYVQNKMVEFAEEIGVSVDVVMTLANTQMDQAVELQKRAPKKPREKSRQQRSAA